MPRRLLLLSLVLLVQLPLLAVVHLLLLLVVQSSLNLDQLLLQLLWGLFLDLVRGAP